MVSRSVIYALANLILALLVPVGVTLSPEVSAQFTQHIDALLVALLVALLGVNGAVVWILRALTVSPLVRGFFKKSTEAEK